MHSKKRGSVEIQFNWIFVILVGAVILLFFYSIVKVQQRTSDKEIGYNTAVDLDSIFTSALESTGTLNVIKIPETTIDFTCYEYYINDVNRPLNDKVVFAPDRLQGKRLMTWAVDWHAPFKVVNFLFVTNPEVRYVIMKPSSAPQQEEMADFIEAVMPEEVVLESYPEGGDVPFKNDYKLRLVYFRDSSFNPANPPEIPDDIKDAPDNVVTAIVVSGSDINGVGNVYFYKKAGNGLNSLGVESFPYLRYESVFAAIFSEDAEMYSCGMKKALFRMDLVSKVYALRTDEIYNHYLSQGDACKDYFIPTHVESLSNHVHTMVRSDDYSFSNFQTLFTDILNVISTARETIAQSCARVY